MSQQQQGQLALPMMATWGGAPFNGASFLQPLAASRTPCGNSDVLGNSARVISPGTSKTPSTRPSTSSASHHNADPSRYCLSPRNHGARSSRLASSVTRSKHANVHDDQQRLGMLCSSQVNAAQGEAMKHDTRQQRALNWRDWQRAPAGLSTMQQDDPQLSRLGAHVGIDAPVWRSAFAGSTLDAGFGRSDHFTNRAFSRTARQSHDADLRHIRHAGPSGVSRIC
mmetsp:Transcript_66972/g.132029  ORF Transcript_66972/g.132029 Transcript_66972/m.132029 type:complete len:225 (+) Transcript_66972:66-740(+)